MKTISIIINIDVCLSMLLSKETTDLFFFCEFFDEICISFRTLWWNSRFFHHSLTKLACFHSPLIKFTLCFRHLIKFSFFLWTFDKICISSETLWCNYINVLSQDKICIFSNNFLEKFESKRKQEFCQRINFQRFFACFFFGTNMEKKLLIILYYSCQIKNKFYKKRWHLNSKILLFRIP